MISKLQAIVTSVILVGIIISALTSPIIVTADDNSGLSDAPWPMFHHDIRHTGQSSYLGPVAYPEVKWRALTRGDINSSPAIGADGTIYVGSDDQWLYAFNPDGKREWRYGTGGRLTSSPAIAADGTIYIGCIDGYLYAITEDGALKWRAELDGRITTSPVIGDDGTIYITDDRQHAYAVSSMGFIMWSYQTIYGISSSPAIGEDGTIYFGSDYGYLHAVNPENGERKWRYETKATISSSPAIGEDGTIYFGSNDKNFYSINPNGSQKWHYQAGEISSSPAIANDGTIYVGSDYGFLYAFTPGGDLKWNYKTGKVVSSPAIGSDGTIYVSSLDGNLYAIDPQGNSKWTINLGDSLYSSPAISANGIIYIGSTDGYLYAIGEGPAPEPPTASFEFSPEDPIATTEITFDATSSTDTDGTIEEYYWEFGNGAFASGDVVTYSYKNHGEYNVTLTVTDNDELTGTTSKTISVTEVISPIAFFEFWPENPGAGEKVAFDASSSEDPDGTLKSYEWNFGDLATGSGEVTSHTYSSPGNYKVTLTVTDNIGASSSWSSDITIGSTRPPSETSATKDDDSGGSGFPISIVIIIVIIVIVLGFGAFIFLKKKAAIRREFE